MHFESVSKKLDNLINLSRLLKVTYINIYWKLSELKGLKAYLAIVYQNMNELFKKL